MNAEVVQLGDVLTGIEAGKSIQTLEREAAPTEPGILKVSAVSWGFFDPSAAKAVPITYAPPETYKVRRGDLLFSRANTSELTGAVAIADRDYPNRYLSDKLLRLVLDTHRVAPEYLLFALRSPAARQHIEGNAGGSSASMRNISQAAMLTIPLFLPDLVRQRTLARQLATAFADASAAVESCKQQIDLGGRLLSRIVLQSFPGVPVSTKASEVKQSQGWQWHRLTDLALLQSGHTPSRRRPEWWGGHVPWLALPDIRKLHGKYAYATTENTNDAGIANSSARVLPVGTVCFSRTASVGFVCILGRPMATSQDFCNWVCNAERLDPEFLMYAFMASQDSLRELGSGAVHKTIYMPTLESFHVCAPEIGEQRRIARRLKERLAAAESLQSSLKSRLADIERLPQRLLASAFASH